MTTDRRPYSDLPTLENVALEDSRVLAIAAGPQHVELRLLVVLTDTHPAYQPPQLGEKYCLGYARLRFGGLSQVEWAPSGAAPGRVLSRNLDFGTIDSFFEANGQYELEGRWGSLAVRSDPPVLTLEEHGPWDMPAPGWKDYTHIEPGYVTWLNSIEESSLWELMWDFNTKYPDALEGVRLAAAKGSVAEFLRADLLEVYRTRDDQTEVLPLSEALDVILQSESWQPRYPNETRLGVIATDKASTMASVPPDAPEWNQVLDEG